MDTATEPREAAPQAPSGRVGWRRILLWGLIGIALIAAAGHVLGGGMLMWIGASAGGLVLIVLVLVFVPRFLRHWRNRGQGHLRQRQHSSVTRTSRTGSPRGLTSHRGGLSGGRRGLFRRGGSGGASSGSGGRRGLFRRSGSGGASSGSRRHPSGMFRRSRAGSGSGSGHRLGGSGRHPSGIFRKRGGTSAGSGRHPSGMFRRRGAGPGSSRRSGALRRRPGAHPAGLRRHRRGLSPGSGGHGRSAPSRRRLTRPSTWFRRAGAGRPGGGSGTGTSGAGAGPHGRRRWSRPSTWLRRRNRRAAAPPGGTGPSAPGGARPKTRPAGTITGPGRGRSRKGRRKTAWTAGADGTVRRRRRLRHPSTWTGRPLTAASAAAARNRRRGRRWWNPATWGQHRPPGRQPLIAAGRARQQRPGRFRRLVNRSPWLRRRLAAYAARRERRRTGRYLGRRAVQAQTPPRRGTRSPAPAGTGRIARTGGGPMPQTAAMADEIHSMGGNEFADPDDVHDYLSNVHTLVEALQENLARKGSMLEEMGVHQAYPQAVQEAANALNGIAQQLEEVVSGGVMRGPGG